MSLRVKCDRCREELKEKGALIFSPPIVQDGLDIVQKYHLCVKCYEWLIGITTEENKKDGEAKDKSQEAKVEGIRGDSGG